MSEFWEESFQKHQAMWGFDPVPSALEAAELFERRGISKVLIPGFGYGRNAQVFIDKGMQVDGIEISETAIQLARKTFDESTVIHHGSISEMPFSDQKYGGIFSYALLHLLNEEERRHFLQKCYNQLEDKGILIIVTLSSNDVRFGKGEKLGDNQFRNEHGVDLYFHNKEQVEKDFLPIGLREAKQIVDGNQLFWMIACIKK
ncbi:MAG: class I SAM-dependent methyltransferase [Crocinitomicaceae bacterium]|nr:class I SAM-dependent methyltransferase [Crocinitomicaceae bacterium]